MILRFVARALPALALIVLAIGPGTAPSPTASAAVSGPGTPPSAVAAEPLVSRIDAGGFHSCGLRTNGVRQLNDTEQT